MVSNQQSAFSHQLSDTGSQREVKRWKFTAKGGSLNERFQEIWQKSHHPAMSVYKASGNPRS
jgi:hypothetical protein